MESNLFFVTLSGGWTILKLMVMGLVVMWEDGEMEVTMHLNKGKMKKKKKKRKPQKKEVRVVNQCNKIRSN